MGSAIRWALRDRYGHDIYLTQERWEHIIASINHPEMIMYEEHLKDAIRVGQRKQNDLIPQKYRYSKPFDNLVGHNTHIVVFVLFRFTEDEDGKPIPNNYIVTAFQKEIG